MECLFLFLLQLEMNNEYLRSTSQKMQGAKVSVSPLLLDFFSMQGLRQDPTLANFLLPVELIKMCACACVRAHVCVCACVRAYVRVCVCVFLAKLWLFARSCSSVSLFWFVYLFCRCGSCLKSCRKCSAHRNHGSLYCAAKLVDLKLKGANEAWMMSDQLNISQWSSATWACAGFHVCVLRSFVSANARHARLFVTSLLSLAGAVRVV